MELKVYHCNEWHNEYTEFYLKNEADKLIERKDKAFEYAQAVILVDIAIIKKQKRKRCLAMANMCRAEMVFWDNYGAKHFDEKYANRKLDHFGKWGQRWLSLYYKFQ
jgi:hypothetical protein